MDNERYYSPLRPEKGQRQLDDEMMVLKKAWTELKKSMQEINEDDEGSKRMLRDAIEDVRARLIALTSAGSGRMSPAPPERSSSVTPPMKHSSPSCRPEDFVEQPPLPMANPARPATPPSPPTAHTPPQRTMELEALYSGYVKPPTPPARAILLSTHQPHEAIPAAYRPPSNPAAIRVKTLKNVPIAVAPYQPAQSVVDPGCSPSPQRSDPDVAPFKQGNVDLPPTMEVYLVSSQNGVRKYHRRYLHLLGNTWVVFSSGEGLHSSLRPREQVSLNAVIGFAPVDQSGQGFHETEPGWFLLSTTHSSYLAIATHPSELQAWIQWFASTHPLVQLGATAAVIRP